MSTSPPVPPPDDRVARATDAMRRVPVPDGPPPETIARTLAALREAEAAPVVIPRTRRRIMFAILKMAGAVLVTAAGVTYFAVFPPAAAKSEFVEAAAKLRDAQTLSLRQTQTMTIAGQPETINARILYKVPGLVRTEPEPAGSPVSVMDSEPWQDPDPQPGRQVGDAAGGAAGAGGGPAPKRDAATMMIEDMRRLAGKDNEPVGEKVIGDVRAGASASRSKART